MYLHPLNWVQVFSFAGIGRETSRAAKAPTMQLTWSTVTKWARSHSLRRQEILGQKYKNKSNEGTGSWAFHARLSNTMAADSPQHFPPVARDNEDISGFQ